MKTSAARLLLVLGTLGLSGALAVVAACTGADPNILVVVGPDAAPSALPAAPPAPSGANDAAGGGPEDAASDAAASPPGPNLFEIGDFEAAGPCVPWTLEVKTGNLASFDAAGRDGGKSCRVCSDGGGGGRLHGIWAIEQGALDPTRGVDGIWSHRRQPPEDSQTPDDTTSLGATFELSILGPSVVASGVMMAPLLSSGAWAESSVSMNAPRDASVRQLDVRMDYTFGMNGGCVDIDDVVIRNRAR